MSHGLLPVVMMILTATGMACVLIGVTHGVDYVRNRGWKISSQFGPSDVKIDSSPYECGMQPYQRMAGHRFSVHFYLVAMLFILFDIEAAFLFPWAVTFKGFAADKVFVLGEMAVFLGILVAGFVYVWARGALEWE